MTIHIAHCQGLCTIQDLGRPHCRAWGVPVGGAADVLSCQLANFVVQNEAGAATVEVAGGHLAAQMAQGAWLAVCGAGGTLYLNGKRAGNGRRVFAPTGANLEIRPEKGGCYAYLAVRGGWDVPEALGSRSTCLAGKFGGLNGRALAPGDRLSAAHSPQTEPPQTAWTSPWQADASRFFLNSEPIRAMAGPEWEEGCLFFDTKFGMSALRDRMGARLEGQPVARQASSREMLSAPVSPGTVQLPPNGLPIVLLADAQTTGGYPRIAQVAAADLPRLAQMPAGHTVRFQQTTMAEAEQLWHEQQQALDKMKTALSIA